MWIFVADFVRLPLLDPSKQCASSIVAFAPPFQQLCSGSMKDLHLHYATAVLLLSNLNISAILSSRSSNYQTSPCNIGGVTKFSGREHAGPVGFFGTSDSPRRYPCKAYSYPGVKMCDGNIYVATALSHLAVPVVH